MVVTGGSDAGTYLPVWNGHGDLPALWRVNADGSLTLAASVAYTTWGRPTVATHNGIGDLAFRYLYVGASEVQWDNELGLGLLYMHARHYSPVLGRFLQPDPIDAEANLYAYAENSPVSRVDPEGTYTINARERAWCTANPYQAAICATVVRSVRDWAFREARLRFNSASLTGGRGDAFRHCCGAAMLTLSVGPRTAKEILDNHEFGDPGCAAAPKIMDLHNNRVGQRIAASIPRTVGSNWGRGGMVRMRIADQRAAVRRCLFALAMNQLRYLHQ